ncbi:MAG: hypothetical protein RLZZ210_984 [Pseudomonadota bacterium]|jgi:SAM-dependent methyltransferase
MWSQWQHSSLGNVWSSYIMNFVKSSSLSVAGDVALHMGLMPNSLKFLPQKNKFSLQDLSIKSNQIPYKVNNSIILNGSYYELPFQDDSMDCILSIHSFDQLEHKHIQHSMQEITRVLRPYGRLIVVNFNPYGLWHIRHKITKLHKSTQTFLPLEHEHNGISYYNFQEMLMNYGMNLHQAQFGIYDLPSNTNKYISFNQKLNQMGNRWWPNLSNIYSLIMTKNVSGMHLNSEKESAKMRYSYNLNAQPTSKEAINRGEV